MKLLKLQCGIRRESAAGFVDARRKQRGGRNSRAKLPLGRESVTSFGIVRRDLESVVAGPAKRVAVERLLEESVQAPRSARTRQQQHKQGEGDIPM